MGAEFSYHQDTEKCCERCLSANNRSPVITYIDTVSKHEPQYRNPDRVHHLYKCSY
jgi:hypothetical protein